MLKQHNKNENFSTEAPIVSLMLRFHRLLLCKFIGKFKYSTGITQKVHALKVMIILMEQYRAPYIYEWFINLMYFVTIYVLFQDNKLLVINKPTILNENNTFNLIITG